LLSLLAWPPIGGTEEKRIMLASEGFDVQGFRAGRPDVLERLYRSHVDQVKRIVGRGFWLGPGRGRVRGVAPPEVPDLVQEVFARAFRENVRRAYDERRQYSPFLAAIARNLVTDWVRRRRSELPVASQLAEPADDDAESPWRDESVLQAVEGYVAALPDGLRCVFEQRYVLGRSQTAAASALGITRQRLRTRELKLRAGLSRALRQAGLLEELRPGPKRGDRAEREDRPADAVP
jgi:RNA polymerase sigma-70 factor (ECF subfamily)